jgi:hypothetical protein
MDTSYKGLRDVHFAIFAWPDIFKVFAFFKKKKSVINRRR